jgi:ABC-type transporter Mla subunit MlaD
MASLKDAEQLTSQLEDLVGELRSELNNGDLDFQKVVSVADELSEKADGVAETFNNLNDTLMQGLDRAKNGGSGGRSRGSSGEAKSESKSSSRGGG